MRLSEAIRLGAMAIKPCRGRWVGYKNNDYSGEVVAGCLYGTALYAIGQRDFYNASEEVAKRWPFLFNKGRVGDITGPWEDVLHFLYEHSGWTREAIADLVEQLEQQIEAEQSALVEQEVASHV